MTFLEVRNTLVSSLAAALGIPVLLSDQVQPEAEVPFIVYSVTAPYASTGELGDHTQTVIEDEDGTEALIDNRREARDERVSDFEECHFGELTPFFSTT